MAAAPTFDEARLPAATDAEIVLHALRGHEPAGREIVRRFERPVYNLVSRMVRDPAAAEDLTQDTFLKIFRSLGTFDPRLRLSAWILKIAHNTALDHLRRARFQFLSLDEDEDGEHGTADLLEDLAAVWPDRATERSHLVAAIDLALDAIRPDYRAALTLRYQEDLDYAEIASVLEVPVGTVKTFLHRGRLALARQLAEAGWGPGGSAKPPAGAGRREE
jgi:RNA polymerase sigma-70 factor (ECF subfamily)